MLKQLKNINPIQEGNGWYVDSSDEMIKQRPIHRGELRNLIDYIKTIQFTNHILNQNRKKLSLEEISQITHDLLDRGIKLKASFDKKNKLLRYIIQAISFVTTRSNLEKSMNSLNHLIVDELGLENEYSGSLQYPQLMKDAQEALQSIECYREVAKRYPNPLHIYTFNPILYHLRQASMKNVIALRNLLKQGKSIDDVKVAELADNAMHIIYLADLMSIKYETQLLSQNSSFTREEQMVNQNSYCWKIHGSFTEIYLWLRAIPIFNPNESDKDKQWNCGCLTQPELIAKFYREKSRQAAWRDKYNSLIAVLHQEINVAKMLKIDSRYDTEYDTLSNIKNPTTRIGCILRYKHIDNNRISELCSDY